MLTLKKEKIGIIFSVNQLKRQNYKNKMNKLRSLLFKNSQKINNCLKRK